MKSDVVTNGTASYSGSVTITITMKYSFPFGPENRSKYSVTVVFSLYGTPAQ